MMPDYRRFSDGLIAQFAVKFRRKAREVVPDVQKFLSLGYSPEAAVARAFDLHKIEAWMLDNVTDSVVKSALYGYGVRPSFALLSNEGLTSKLLSLSYDGSERGLSGRIHDAVEQAKKTIATTVQTALRSGHGLRETAQQLFDGYGYGQRLDMPGVEMHKELKKLALAEKARIGELRRAGITGISPDPVIRKLRRLESYTDTMARQNLRVAYKQLIKTINSENAKAVEKAVYVAVQEKFRSHATMIAQTEIAEAYGNAFEARSVQDPDVAGIKYSLSSDHEIFDICDYHTSVDYGYGPGVYPLKSIPDFPFHPRCNCRMREVFRGELPEDARIDPVAEEQGARKYLKSLSEDERRDLMGVRGSEEFKDFDRWKANLRNYRGHREAVQGLKTSDFIRPL